MLLFIHGAIAMGFSICSLFFLRFWRSTSDRFFAIFGLAFMILAVERCALLSPGSLETLPYIYSLRLLSSVFILVAIVDKNRRHREL